LSEQNCSQIKKYAAAYFEFTASDCRNARSASGIGHYRPRQRPLPPTHFRNANLSFANLDGADLRSTDLSGANLSYADLSSAHLSSAYLDEACGNVETKLPKDLTVKPCK
jgi:uncharacterized protein YjbI with pentapeptide repeats